MIPTMRQTAADKAFTSRSGRKKVYQVILGLKVSLICPNNNAINR